MRQACGIETHGLAYRQKFLQSYRKANRLEVIETPRGPTKRQDEYVRYLQSQRWRPLARAVCIRAKGKCEICLRADGEECAHLTYERIFNERITDLLWVCKKCHRELDNRW